MPSLTTLLLTDADDVEKDWDESQHPRDEKGKFSDGSSAAGKPKSGPGMTTMRRRLGQHLIEQAAARERQIAGAKPGPPGPTQAARAQQMAGAAQLPMQATSHYMTAPRGEPQTGQTERYQRIMEAKNAAKIKEQAARDEAQRNKWKQEWADRQRRLGQQPKPIPPFVNTAGNITAPPKQPPAPAQGPKQAPQFEGAAARDPKEAALVAVARARLLGEGSKTIARQARAAAVAAVARGQGPPGKYGPANLAAAAREAVRAEVGGPYKKRPQEGAKMKEGRAAAAGKAPAPVNVPAGPQIDHTPVENHLRNDEVVSLKVLGDPMHGNVSTSYRATFKDGSLGVYKPASEGAEDQARPHIPLGQDNQREAAAWDVAKIVGMDDMVPQTVVRTAGIQGKGVGSMQNFVPLSTPAYEAKDAFDGSRDFSRAAVFDYAIGHEDRHGKNWMVTSDGKMHLIDNGLAFPEATKLSSIRGYVAAAGGSEYNGMKPPKTMGTPADWAKTYVDNKEAILKAVRAQGLSERAVDGVSARISRLATMTDWKELTKGGDPQGWAIAPRGGGVGAAARRNRAKDAKLAALLRRFR